MEASAAADALGTPPHKKETGRRTERWTYPGRRLVVFIGDGKVARWREYQREEDEPDERKPSRR